MTIRLFKRLLVLTAFAGLLLPQWATAVNPAADAAREVVARTFGQCPPNVEFRTIDPAPSGCDRFATEVRDGRLRVEGSSPVALCYGFYNYIATHGYGVCTWSGSRLELPARLPDQARRETTSPFRRRLYMNVCTFGYTSPFWSWDEWEHEIDWMALHGFDMPLAPIASEAILARVWREMGLTDREIGELFTGPAHLPWMRMGNMSGLDGAPTQAWHREQIAFNYLGILNSIICEKELSILSPTMNFEAGQIGRVTLLTPEKERVTIVEFVKQNIQLSKSDWDAFETSWDFKRHPLV